MASFERSRAGRREHLDVGDAGVHQTILWLLSQQMWHLTGNRRVSWSCSELEREGRRSARRRTGSLEGRAVLRRRVAPPKTICRKWSVTVKL